MWFKDCRDQIKVILDQFVTDNKIWEVFAYPKETHDKYPWCIIIQTDWEERELDTNTNLFTALFEIRIVEQNKTWQIQTLENNMIELCDDIMAELRKKSHTLLWWYSIKFFPKRIKWGWYESDETLRVFTIDVEVEQTFSIS